MRSTATSSTQATARTRIRRKALLDIYTLIEEFGDLSGRTVAIVGDVAHSRVAHSTIRGLAPAGRKRRPGRARRRFFRRATRPKASRRARLRRGAAEGRRDRAAAHSARALRRDAALRRRVRRRLPARRTASEDAAPDAIVMHPGPVQPRHGTRRLACSSSPAGATLKQVHHGVAHPHGRSRFSRQRAGDEPRQPADQGRPGRRPVASARRVARRAHHRRHRVRDRRASRRARRTKRSSTPPARSSRRDSSTCTCTCASPDFPKKRRSRPEREAAVRGGFTAVACMPNTQPRARRAGASSNELLRDSCRRRALPRLSDRGDHARPAGKEPCDFAALARAGAVAFSDDGDTVAMRACCATRRCAARDVAGASSRTARMRPQGRRRHERGRDLARLGVPEARRSPKT